MSIVLYCVHRIIFKWVRICNIWKYVFVYLFMYDLENDRDRKRVKEKKKNMIAHRVAFAVDPGYLYDIAADYSCESQRIGTHHIIYNKNVFLVFFVGNILSDAYACLWFSVHFYIAPLFV